MVLQKILKKIKHKKGILLFDGGFCKEAACQLEHFVRPSIPRAVFIKRIVRGSKLVRELSKGIYPLAILEHWSIWGVSPDKLPSRWKRSNIEANYAYDLLPELIDVSPDTKFIICCHTRGVGIGKDKFRYERFPNVIATIGWISSASNARLIIRTIKNLYLL